MAHCPDGSGGFDKEILVTLKFKRPLVSRLPMPMGHKLPPTIAAELKRRFGESVLSPSRVGHSRRQTGLPEG